MNENFSMFIRTFLPRYAQPDADAIENLSMPIVVDQKRLGGGSHSTLGSITDIYTVLRRLYSHIGKPFVGHANVFLFNDGEELADASKLFAATRGLHCDRRIRRGCFELVQPRHVYGHHGRGAQGFRGREQGEPIAV